MLIQEFAFNNTPLMAELPNPDDDPISSDSIIGSDAVLIIEALLEPVDSMMEAFKKQEYFCEL